jgi:hypothetical protein
VPKETTQESQGGELRVCLRMGAPKFVTYAFDNYDVKVTPEEAHKDREQFFADYSRSTTLARRQRNLARRYHRVESPIGRVRHLPDILSADDDVRAEAERQAINSPVQSLASDLMLMALIRLHHMMDPKECFIIFTVHDELGFQCREDCVDKYGSDDQGDDGGHGADPRKFGWRLPYRSLRRVEYGQHWGEPEFELNRQRMGELAKKRKQKNLEDLPSLVPARTRLGKHSHRLDSHRIAPGHSGQVCGSDRA